MRCAQRLAAADPRLAFIGRQFGMFSMLPLTQGAGARAARATTAIYMADSGRFNVVGMADDADRPIHRRGRRGAGWLSHGERDAGRVATDVDWREVARLVLTSREMDRIEEEELVPAKKVLYQFSARGHDMAQVLLGLQLKDGDAACGYYRSRPLLLALGVPLADALGLGHGPGRRLFRRPRYRRRVQLSQSRAAPTRCRCAAGSARNIRRRPAGRRRSPTRPKCSARGRTTRSRVVLGGDASCATGGFWSALTIATTQQLPLLIYIEDNGYGISVPSDYQTPGKDIAANLASFAGLTIFNGDGTEPEEAARLIDEAVGACPRRKRRRRCCG